MGFVIRKAPPFLLAWRLLRSISGKLKARKRKFGGAFFTLYYGLELIGAEPEFHDRNSWPRDNHPEKVPPHTHSKDSRMELRGRGPPFRAAKLGATSIAGEEVVRTSVCSSS